MIHPQSLCLAELPVIIIVVVYLYIMDVESVCLSSPSSAFPAARTPRAGTLLVIIIIIIPGQCLWCCHHDLQSLPEFTRFL